MSFSAFRLGSDPPKDEPSPKFIVATPGERPAPKLFVSNDPDDGYNLTFPCLADFETWRQQEEDTHTIEFIKGDTHGSRTNPPRFKEHVKLVCARHTRRGRKQYVKKHPERTRKTPSRKIDGVGCPASICYKTYVDTDVVRAMYNQEHSHPTGLANLPFTRKGQRSLARSKSVQQPSPTSVTSTSEDESQSSNAQSPCVPVPRIPVFRPRSLEGSEQHASPQNQWSHAESGSDEITHSQPHVGFESYPSPGSQSQSSYTPVLDHREGCPQLEYQPSQQQVQTIRSEFEAPHSPVNSIMHGLPSPAYNISPYPPPPPVPTPPSLTLSLPDVPTAHERWERLAVLFRSVHTHALTFEYPHESVSALENMLVQLYLESPLAGGALQEPAPLDMGVMEMGALGDNGMSVMGEIRELDAMGCVMQDAGMGVPHGHQGQLHVQPPRQLHQR